MIDFTPVQEKQIPWPEFAARLNRQDLIDEVNQLTDTILEILVECSDFAVAFAPHDPEAHDPYAENPEDEDLGWGLGHLIAHITASNEESAFMGAELARGVEVEPRRSRFEIDWEAITTLEQARHRLQESRRMVLASLDVWPDEPHLQNAYKTRSGLEVTPMVRVLFGFSHASSHLAQIEEVIRQAKEAKTKSA
ncbi:MAG: DinB family protein [Chloroflexota bacterium]